MGKLVEGQLWAEVTGHDMGSHETIFVWVSYFILLVFCTKSDEGS